MKRNLTVLLIEDDRNIIELLQLYMDKLGFRTIAATDGEEGFHRFFEVNPDFVILDLMLPGMSGLEICREIRKEQPAVPIIILTGKGESYDRISGLETGADDYMVKPFDPNELIARMRAVLRRSSPMFVKEPIQLPGLLIDMEQYKLLVHGGEVSLPPKEMELLYFLASSPNRVMTRQQIIDQLWGYDFEGDSRTVDVHIKRLREKLGEASASWSLQTIRGVGYKFRVHDDA